MPMIRELLGSLQPDPWRAEVGFTEEIQSASDSMYARDGVSASEVLAAWLARHQPCLFGKYAARTGLLRYCILSADDLMRTDDELRSIIQSARTAWKRAAFQGAASGFVLLASSPDLAVAEPNDSVLAIAERLCSLYLLQERTDPDRIYLDDLFLTRPGENRTTWKWDVGMNYFSAHGDKRWWADHRIPAGIGFSLNSVGHMMKAGAIAQAMKAFDKAVGGPPEDLADIRMDSLDDALRLAMSTIDNASQATSGKATWLLPLVESDESRPKCPIELEGRLLGKDYCSYLGYYHTDETMPADYFRSEIMRPSETREHMLDFTYLFHDSADNPAHQTMGLGVQIRAGGAASPLKYARAHEAVVNIDEYRRSIGEL